MQKIARGDDHHWHKASYNRAYNRACHEGIRHPEGKKTFQSSESDMHTFRGVMEPGESKSDPAVSVRKEALPRASKNFSV